ncbi:uncharacterized protein LOC143876132 isoform X2 [Tasmannia lanceolata]|uniref:uncharacterized protein LOC143876132 isoform X2 n=1 Tax=Tasmannia lanceolata TaxID=3420 RepID=UPI00406423B3
MTILLSGLVYSPVSFPNLSAPTAPQSDTMTISRADYNELQCLRLSSRPPTAGYAQPGSSPATLLTSSSSWIIDSGASNHLTGSHDWEDDWLGP